MVTPDLVQISPNNSGAMPPGCCVVVIHATRSGVSMNPSEFEGTLNYMSTPGTTSSHWVISREGVKARVVYDDLMSWHSGPNNERSFGIELEQGVEDDGFTEAQMDALVLVCQGYMADYGIEAVHCHTTLENGFVGHEETLQGMSWGKTDPGHLFDWDAFIAALGGGGDDDAMIVLNATSEWYADPANQQIPAGEKRGVNAIQDFGLPLLPGGASAVEVEVYTQAGSPAVRVCHGGVAAEHAFLVPFTSGYMKGKVYLDADGWFQLQALDSAVWLQEVHCCGYYT